jgi:hypothetical protein
MTAPLARADGTERIVPERIQPAKGMAERNETNQTRRPKP